MAQYGQWTRQYLKSIVREELMDPGARWWSDAELNLYCDNWQTSIQQDWDLVWGSSSCMVVGNGGTYLPPGGQFAPVLFNIAQFSPTPDRIDAFYWNGWRLSGRLLEDLEVGNKEWRAALPDTPRMVVQYDSNSFFFWPTPSVTGYLEMEYPIVTTFSGDSDTVKLPFWTQYTARPFICAMAYIRPGPTNDIQKAAKYQKIFATEKAKAKAHWEQYHPYRYRKLKPMGMYEKDILIPPPAMGQLGTFTSTITATGTVPSGEEVWMEYVPSGTINGTNTVFTLPVLPVALQLFRNGVLLNDGTFPTDVDYTTSGTTITFNSGSQPQTGDTLIAWVLTAGA